MLTPSYWLGLIFIAAVALIWAASSVFTQHLYTNVGFDRPFLLTYVGVSLFTLWLPTHHIMTLLGLGGGEQDKHDYRRQPHLGEQGGVGEGGIRLRHRQSYEQIHNVDDEGEHQQDDVVVDHHHQQQQQQPPLDNPNDEAIWAAHSDNNAHHVAAVTEDSSGSCWTHADHVRAAFWIAPVWFVANWTYNASLRYTSITSSTVLASTGSLFTFLFAYVSGDEHFGVIKLCGVLLGVLGSVLTAFQDASNDDHDQHHRGMLSSSSRKATWGDTLGLVSAMGYGLYAVQTRLLCPHDERLYSMQLLLGYIGLWNMTVLLPFVLYQCMLTDMMAHVTWSVLGMVAVKGLFDNVLSDYLWLRAVMLTNATVATVGLGLTIPLAICSDALLGKGNVLSWGALGGATLVLAGFVLVNIGTERVGDIAPERSPRGLVPQQDDAVLLATSTPLNHNAENNDDTDVTFSDHDVVENELRPMT